MTSLTIICIALIAFCAYREWSHSKDRREREQAWRLHETGLLNRIQAPEVAALPEVESTAYVPPEDDDAYWQAESERELAS